MTATAWRTAAGALLSHWRRHPGQALTLLLGLALATALWTGVQAINSEARASYDRAAALLGQQGRAELVARNGGRIPLAAFVALRRAGWPVSPVLEGTARIGGQTVTLLGLDPLSAPVLPAARDDTGGGADALTAFITAPGQFLVAPETAAALDGALAQEVLISDDVPPGLLVGDLSTVARILGRPDDLSRLIEIDTPPAHVSPLATLAPDLERRQPDRQADIAGLTGSFHLNLTAFGFLSFAVGLFIVHGAVGLAFEQRRGMIRTLRALGIPGRGLAMLLAAELLIVALLAGAVGVGLGYLVAASLLPDVSATLRGLYGAPASGTLALRPGWILAGFGIALAGTALAAGQSLSRLARMPVLASAQPRAWRLASNRGMRRQALVAGVFLAVAAGVAPYGQTVEAGFATLGAMFFGAALILPPVLAVMLTAGQALARRPLAQWFWADTRQQLPGLSLALTALMLALAANIGVSTMVGSFRATFTGWLDQRLIADLYVSAGDARTAAALSDWLQAEGIQALARVSTPARLNDLPGTVQALDDSLTWRQHWPMLQAGPLAWDDLAAGHGVFINEQMHYREGIELGGVVRIDGQAFPVLGIYSDYGNPTSEAVLTMNQFRRHFPEIPVLRFSLRVPEADKGALAADLRARFALPADRIVDQAVAKARSMEVFERTFAVTGALNVLTLGVAALAMFTSLLALSAQRLPQLAPVWALGTTRGTLTGLELLRSAVLAGLTAMLAVPVGLALGWMLLAVVNVAAFGWRLPMIVFPADLIRLCILGLIAGVFAAALPARRLATRPPADLLRIFAHER